MFTIVLKSRGNPDHGQDPDEAVSPQERVKVKSFAAAALVARDYITDYDLGGGNWTGGQVFKGKKQVARVSYNGRVWTTDGEKEIKV